MLQPGGTATVEARASEARIACVLRASKWGRKLPTFTSMCARHCKAPIRPHLRAFEAFRGLPRPHSWGFEAFRGLARPRQNRKTPFSLQDYEASGTRAYIILLKGSYKASGPDELWLPLFFRLYRILGRSWLQVPFILERGLQRLKMILQLSSYSC